MHFTPEEEARLKEIISGIETRAGVQVLTAVIAKADAYPEAPWIAFALASSLSALLLTVQALLDPPWIVPFHATFFSVTVLGIGVASALLTTLWHPFARLFVTSARRKAEVDQFARAFFQERELFCTRDRTGVLLLVSLFERKIVILPDTGVARRISEPVLEEVVARMTPHLTRGARYEALVEGLAGLQKALHTAGFSSAPDARDEIPDELVQERGPKA